MTVRSLEGDNIHSVSSGKVGGLSTVSHRINIINSTLENSTGITSFSGRTNVSLLQTITKANLTIEQKSRGGYDGMVSENYTLYGIEKHQTHFIKPPTKVFIIPPPTPNNNNSAVITLASNTSTIIMPALITVLNNTSALITRAGNTSTIFTRDLITVLNTSNLPVNASGISHGQFNRPITTFPGLNSTNTCNGCLPPDVQIGVGINNVVEVINGAMGYWTKQGNLIKVNDINNLFNISANHITADPMTQ